METLAERFNEARNIFPTPNNDLKKVPGIVHNGEKHPTKNARDALLAIEITVECLNKVFTENGEYIISDRGDFDLDRMSFTEITNSITDRFKQHYDLVSPSLDQSTEFGYNRHDLHHAKTTADYALEILKHTNASEIEMKYALVGGLIHDLGNIFSRKYHEIISRDMLRLSIPELRDKPKQLQAIGSIVFFHNEPSLTGLFKHYKAETHAQRIEVLKKLSPATLAVILADKSTYGLSRITGKEQGPDAILHKDPDNHLILNLLYQTTGIKVTDDEFHLDLNFKPGLAEDEKLAKRYGKGDGSGVIVPKWMHELNLQYGIPHLYSSFPLFMKIYGYRLILASEAAFALFPKMKNFIINVKDNPKVNTKKEEVKQLNNSGMNMILTINRTEIDEYIAALANMHMIDPEN